MRANPLCFEYFYKFKDDSIKNTSFQCDIFKLANLFIYITVRRKGKLLFVLQSLVDKPFS